MTGNLRNSQKSFSSKVSSFEVKICVVPSLADFFDVRLLSFFSLLLRVVCTLRFRSVFLEVKQTFVNKNLTIRSDNRKTPYLTLDPYL